MIKRMERRFIVVAVSVVSLVLLLIIIAVNVISIRSNISSADQALNDLAFKEGEDFKPNSKDNYFNIGDIFNNNEPDKRSLDKENNRSFEVLINDELDLISTNASDKNIVEDVAAYDMGLQAIYDDQEYGFFDDYRYLVVEEDNQIRVIFLDYSFERRSEVNFYSVSLGVFVLGVFLVAILVKIFMKPIMKPIRESYIKQRQFITDASHELKTPLTVMSTGIELIEMESGSTKWTKSISNQIGRLKTLSNELVTLSRLDEDNIKLMMSKVNLSDLVNDVVMGFEPAIEAGGKNLTGNIEDDIIIDGNYDALEKVLSILMHNALKYSNKQGTIKVDLLKKSKNIYLSVFNSTDKIEKGNHDEYFERFYRSDKSRNSKTGGFGIGLAVAKSTIEEHEGKIRAYSSDEKCLEVLITL